MSNEGTLARHGIAFRFNGIPWYDEDGVIAGIVNEPWWYELDLTAEQLAEVDVWVAEHLSVRPQDEPLWVRWSILEHNGVYHAHREGKPIYEHRPAYGFECSMCKAAVINPNPGDSRFNGGPWNGRWIVTDGRPTYIAPIIPPISVVAEPGDALSTPTIQTVTYRRGRDGDYYVDRQTYPVEA